MTHFRNVRVIINPASGRDEPILNPINDVFNSHDIRWDAHITHGPGDATRLTRRALDDGADLIVCYGGDGTSMEVVNGLVGRGVPLALLPGGTGNGVATELGIPPNLREALQVIVEDRARRKLDLGYCNDRYFMLRAFVGLPNELNPSRELKDKIGFLAYPLFAARFLSERSPSRFVIKVDDFAFEEDAILCLVNNIGYSNSPRLPELMERLFLDVQIHQGEETVEPQETVLNKVCPDDGLLDVLLVTGDQSILHSLTSLVIRHEETSLAKVHLFQGRSITVEASPPQEIRLDGEEGGTTPCRIEIIPQGVEIIVPN